MKNTYILNGLGCANCASKMETEIKKMEGVTDVTVNFFSRKMMIECDEYIKALVMEKVKKIIKKIEPDVKMEELK